MYIYMCLCIKYIYIYIYYMYMHIYICVCQCMYMHTYSGGTPPHPSFVQYCSTYSSQDLLSNVKQECMLPTLSSKPNAALDTALLAPAQTMKLRGPPKDHQACGCLPPLSFLDVDLSIGIREIMVEG